VKHLKTGTRDRVTRAKKAGLKRTTQVTKKIPWTKLTMNETLLQGRGGNTVIESAITLASKAGSVDVNVRSEGVIARIVDEIVTIVHEIEIEMTVFVSVIAFGTVNVTGIVIVAAIGIVIVMRDDVNARSTDQTETLTVIGMALGKAREGGAGLNHWKKNLLSLNRR